MRRASAGILVTTLVALSAAVACGPEERQVRYVLKKGRGTAPWQPESSIGPTPEKFGMLLWEVTDLADASEPTGDQRLAAEDLIARSFAAVESHRWYDFETGRADGFELMALDEVHYVNEEFVFDDGLLDPERPEFLMYYNTSQGRVLTGIMYYVRKPLERGPQIGGPLTLWHYHVWAGAHCFKDDMLVIGKTYEGGLCAQGVASFRSPEMIHVWLLDREGGPFASSMTIDREELPGLLEKRRRERGW